ncbi:putative transitional endoplasmic reticulum ATPase [Podospora australis]|uniref:Transitional endoplasmic reticulum ATPase n=1 Tax=Podospora australis TaxID=1536484 RepID=A0AAN7AFT5_9PEZI|nr:putative transitional endoplasmic reticulum ATPase [Podospora australis]
MSQGPPKPLRRPSSPLDGTTFDTTFERPVYMYGAEQGDPATTAFFSHSSAPRISTDAVIAAALKKQYPNLHLSIVPSQTVDFLGYAQATDHASFQQLTPEASGILPADLTWKIYLPPTRRIDGSQGGIVTDVLFGKFLYKYQGAEFFLYVVDGRDGGGFYPQIKNYYLLSTEHETPKAESLIVAAGKWANELRDEVWVFDGGYWQKSRELFESIQKSSWDNVILDEDMKKAIIRDHTSFFDSRGQYERLKVPWKRGVIYYGPPGNGKTISIKAMMKTLWEREDSVPALYVRSLSSWAGPEYSINQIFFKARQFSPCYLILEDLDSLVSDNVRSYFLNEIDGLKSNDGIFIVGSTNHLDRLDPGISKRPSRFDRKYLFPDPSLDQRIAYCHFWQNKLKSNKDLEFPDKLCKAIAEITDGFSFAYIQEAFVAALLVIARDSETAEACNTYSSVDPTKEDEDDDWEAVQYLTLGRRPGGDDDDTDIEKLVLWVEIKKQIQILREGIEEEKHKEVEKFRYTRRGDRYD